MSAKEHRTSQRDAARATLVSNLVIGADDVELRALIAEQGGTPAAYVEKSRKAFSDALTSFRSAKGSTRQQNEGALGLLLALLRRKEQLTEEELAQRANVDPEEIRRIEFDARYIPQPRTIFQLERHFTLPEKSMLKLSGAIEYDDPAFDREITRFAARAKRLESLTREEVSLLNEFVKFLGKHTS